MKRTGIGLFMGLLVFSLSCYTLWAQATAQVSGTARDQSGAVLPGVEITVTHVETGIARSAITNETGSYILPNLATGPYRLEAALPGFRTYAQTGIVLQVNSSPVINVVLEIGQVAETVEVQANAGLVETRNSSVGTVIENQRILELPLNGRNVTELISLAGGAVKERDLTAQYTASSSPTFAIGGGSSYGVDYTLDGANHISFISGTTMSMPFPDAMQEFKVETSGVSAQRGGSAAVSAVTKSGTNEFHGNLFEFVRNDLFNARSYFAQTNSTLKRNQFGGTFGGPIVRNKLFFFGGYQGTILRSDPADIRTFLPTAAVLAGDWSTFASPACAGRQITLRAPFVNNRIDPALYSKPALFIVNWKGDKPFPKSDHPCGEFTYGDLTGTNEGNYVGKIDYQMSDKHTLFGRVLIATHNETNPDSFNTNLLQNTGWITSKGSSYTLGSTYLLNANMIQAFRLAVNRYRALYYGTGAPGTTKLFNWCDAGVKIYCPPEATRVYGMSINGAFSLTSLFPPPNRYLGTSYTMNEEVSLIRGDHQISFGINVMQGRQNNLTSGVSQPRFGFNGAETGLGLADFMLGRVGTMTNSQASTHTVKATTVGAYATDTWKAFSRLTLSYGMRWEPYLPQWVDHIFNFDYERFRQGTKSSVYLNAPAGFGYPGDPGFPENGINARWLQFAPRMGLAWDITGNGRSSLRASYALTYVYVPGTWRLTYSGAAPWNGRTNLTSPPGGLEDPYGHTAGDIFPYVLDKNAPFPPSGQFFTQRPDTRTPYTQSWNLSLQRQIGEDWLVSASYTGSNTMHVWTKKPINPAIYFPGGTCILNGVTYNPCSSLGNTDARRRFTLERPADGAKLAHVTELDDGGAQTYSGLVLSAARRAAEGLTVSANYTWSHCIGPYGTLYNPMGGQASQTYEDPDDRSKDQGNCDPDRRHVLNLTGVAEMPQFANSTLRVLATGWRLAGIYRISSGIPLTILSGSDRALNGASFRASQVLGDPFGDRSGRPGSAYLNRAAFTLPALGTFGNTRPNSIQGPRIWDFDIALSRVIPVRENQRLEFRAEAYNVTNSFRPGNPNTTITNPNFGVIRTSLEPRILQFALKYVF